MRTLCPGKDHGGRVRGGWGGRRHAHFNPLVSHEVHAGTSVLSAAGVAPVLWRETNLERMQHHADLARLRGLRALPLTLRAQRAGTTPTDAGSLHQAQASIGFMTPLVAP